MNLGGYFERFVLPTHVNIVIVKTQMSKQILINCCEMRMAILELKCSKK